MNIIFPNYNKNKNKNKTNGLRDYTTIIQILTTPESLEQYKPIQYKTRPTTPAVNMDRR